MLKAKRLLCLLLAMLIIQTSVVSFAQVNNEDFCVSFTVTEQNGVFCEKYLIKRGIPIGDNILRDAENLEVFSLEKNAVIPSHTKVLETYESGYAKWVLVAIAQDIKPHETQNYILRTGKGVESDIIKVGEVPGGSVSVDNGVCSIKIGTLGINSIIYNGIDVLDEKGVVSYSEEYEKEKRLKSGGSIQIVENNDIYTEIKVLQEFDNDAIMRIEKVFTITADSPIIHCETRHVSHMGSITYDDNNTCMDTINSLYDKYYFNDVFDSFSYSDESLKRKTNPIYSCDYVKLYDTESATGVAIVSKDVQKFRGGVTPLPDICNGFYYDNEENSLIFAPILYKKAYTKWIDGTSKTTHNEIILYRDRSKTFDDIIETRINTPWVNIDKKQFIDAGLIKTTDISAMAQLQLDEIKWHRKNKVYGKWLAGIVPYSINSYRDTCSGEEVLLGEITYNTWFGAMVSGDGTVFDAADEGTESWSDNSVYRGRVADARGAARSNYNKLNPANHPFYNEFSNCYIGYLMTGNNYYKDTCKLMADFFYRTSHLSTFGNGFHIALGSSWRYNMFEPNQYDETRFNYSIRAMQNSYNLFKDEDYAFVAKGISDWLAFCQEPEGFWYQFYDRDGNYFDLMKTPQPLCKDYIMLYSARGYKDYYDMTKDPVMKETLIKFGDYLINEMGDRGWMYSPCTDPQICEMGEDGSRGKSPMQEIMAAEIFEMLYRETKDVKYFKAFCTAIRSYYSSCYKNGLAVMHFNEPQYAGGIMNAVNGGQVLNIMRMDNVYTKLIRDNEELVRELGFDDLLIALAPGSKYVKEGLYTPHNDKEVTTTLIEAPDGKRVFFMGNNSGKESGEWKKTLEVHIKDAAIWTNTTTRISSKLEAVVGHDMEYFDYASCMELPLKLETISGTGITFNDTVMTDEKISFTASADNGQYVFSITDEEYNTISVSGDKIKTVTITKGNGSDNSLMLDFSSQKISDIENHWVRDDALILINAGILKGNTDATIRPDSNVTLNELLLLTMRAVGYSDSEAVNKAAELKIISENDLERLNQEVSREKATDIVYKALALKIKENKLPVRVNEFLTVKNVKDDKEAVMLDADRLSFESDIVYEDMHLPKEGPYGSTITWHSSDESFIAPNGMVNLPSDEDKKVTLTATVKRNEEVQQKSFEFVVKSASNVLWNAFEGFTDIHKTQTIDGSEKSFSIEATPMGDIVDIVLGFASSENATASYGSLNLKWRFNSSGFIDAHNATAYQAAEQIRYEKDMKYRFDVTVRFKDKTYDLAVTDENGNTRTVAKNYVFSTNAPSMTKLDEFYFIATDISGQDSSATITKFDIAYAATQGKYALDTAREYWNIQTGDADIVTEDGYVYYSSDKNVITENGKYINSPENDKTVFILGIPSNKTVLHDYEQISDSCFVSAMKAKYIGLVNGDKDGYFNPKDILKRAECITIVNNLRQLTVHFDTMFPR